MNIILDDSIDSVKYQGHDQTQNNKLKLYKKKRPIVQQTEEEAEFNSTEVENYDLVNPKTFDEYFYLVEAFNLGFRVKNFFPAARDCTKTLRIFLNDANSTVENANTTRL